MNKILFCGARTVRIIINVILDLFSKSVKELISFMGQTEH